jgi:hypothetical protein
LHEHLPEHAALAARLDVTPAHEERSLIRKLERVLGVEQRIVPSHVQSPSSCASAVSQYDEPVPPRSTGRLFRLSFKDERARMRCGAPHTRAQPAIE